MSFESVLSGSIERVCVMLADKVRIKSQREREKVRTKFVIIYETKIENENMSLQKMVHSAKCSEMSGIFTH